MERNRTLGFELTELVDRAFMSRFSSSLKLKEYYNQLWRNNMKADDRSRFKAHFADAIIYIDYVDATSIPKRKSVAELLLQALVELPKGMSGKVLKNDLRVLGCCIVAS